MKLQKSNGTRTAYIAWYVIYRQLQTKSRRPLWGEDSNIGQSMRLCEANNENTLRSDPWMCTPQNESTVASTLPLHMTSRREAADWLSLRRHWVTSHYENESRRMSLKYSYRAVAVKHRTDKDQPCRRRSSHNSGITMPLNILQQGMLHFIAICHAVDPVPRMFAEEFCSCSYPIISHKLSRELKCIFPSTVTSCSDLEWAWENYNIILTGNRRKDKKIWTTKLRKQKRKTWPSRNWFHTWRIS